MILHHDIWKKCISGFLLSSFLLSPFATFVQYAEAAVPTFINYQSRLRDSLGDPITATTTIQFSIYSTSGTGAPTDTPSSAGPLLWTETYDQAAGNCAYIDPDTDGYFTVKLGSCTSFPSYLDFTSDSLYLGVKISTDSEASPRAQLGTAPYAYTAEKVSGTSQSTIGTTTAADNAMLTVEATSTNSIAAVFRAAIGQVANIFEAVSAAGEKLLTLTANGLFGIGTSTPTSLLSVGGDATIDGDLTVTGTTTTNNLIATNATSTNFSVTGFLDVSGNSVLTDATTTSLYTTTLGINSEYFLDLTGEGLSLVSGALTVATSTLTVASSTYAALAGTSTYAYLAGTSTYAYLSGTSTYAYLSGTSTYALLSGTSTVALSLYGFDQNDYLLAANNLSDLTSSSTARTNLGLGTMAVQDANNVAITGGTAIFGSATSTNLYASSVFGLNGDYFTDLTGTGLALVNGALTVATSTFDLDPSAIALTEGFLLVGDATNQATETSSIFIANDGHVGIGTGTSSPLSLLTVGGSITPSSNLAYDLGSSTARWKNVWAETFNVGTSTWSIFNAAAGRLAISDASEQGGNERLTIDTNGNVGIGTTSPAAKLDVNGDANTLRLAVNGTGDRLVDADGSSTTDDGTGDAITYGTVLTAVDVADNLCTDSVTSPTIVFVHTSASSTCNTANGTIVELLGTTTASTTYTQITSGWAFVDGDADNAYDDGEDLYIDSGTSLAFDYGGIYLASSSDAFIASTLYQYNNTLYWNGSPVVTTNSSSDDDLWIIPVPIVIPGVPGAPGEPGLTSDAPVDFNDDVRLNNKTPGSVLFIGADQSISESNYNFFWDQTFDRLGIQTRTPRAALEVNDDALITGDLTVNLVLYSKDELRAQGNAFFEGSTWMYNPVYISTTTADTKVLDVTGDSFFKGEFTIDTNYDPGGHYFNVIGRSLLVGETALHASGTVDTLTVNGGIIHSVSNADVIGSLQDVTDLNGAIALKVFGDYAYVAAQDANELTIVDVSDPTAPVFVGSVQDAVNLNAVTDVFVAGRYAYVTSGLNSSISIVDISDPSLPRIAATIQDTTLSGASGIYVAGNYAYVVSPSQNNIVVVDISTSVIENGGDADIYELKDDTNLNGVRDVYVQGNYAYLVSPVSDLFKVVDISDPTNMTITGSLTGVNFNGANGLYVSGNWAYVAAYNANRLQIVDISDPSNPIARGGVSDATQLNGARAVFVSGDYAYVAAPTGNRVTIVDVSDPLAPEITQSIQDATNLNTAYDVYVSGRNAFVVSPGGDRLTVIDTSGVTLQSVEAGNLQTGALTVTDDAYIANSLSAGSLFIHKDSFIGGKLALGDPTNGNIIGDMVPTVNALYDLGTEVLSWRNLYVGAGDMAIVGGIKNDSTLAAATGLAMQGNYAYVTSANDSRLSIIDISDKEEPVVVGSVKDATNLVLPNGVDVQGSYAYVVSEGTDSLNIIDITHPTEPAIVGRVTSPIMDSPFNVHVVGERAYVVSSVAGSLAIVNVSDPENPTIEGSIASLDLDGAEDVYVRGRYAYVAATNDDSFQVIDVSNPYSPTIVGGLQDSTNLVGIGAVFVSGRYAYVTAQTGDNMAIIDIASSTNPTLAGTVADATLLDQPSDVFSDGRFAYVTAQNSDTLVIIDVSSSTNPTILQNLQDAADLNGPQAVSVVGKYAYVANATDNSLRIVELSGVRAPTADIGVINAGSIAVAHDLAVNGQFDANTLFVRKDAFIDGKLALGNSLSVGVGDPVIVGGIKDDVTLNTPTGLDIQGNYAYVLSSTDGRLSIIDTTDKTEPEVVGSIQADALTLANDVTVEGYYAYAVGGTDDALRVIDISDPIAPVIVGVATSSSMEEPYSVFISGEKAYVASQLSNSLTIINIGNPEAPKVEGSVTDVTNLAGIADVYVRGQYAYVAATDNNSLRIIDISDPYNPTLVSGLQDTTNLNGISSVFVLGRYAYVTAQTNDSMRIIDIASSTNPTLVGGLQHTTILNGASDVFTDGTHAYVTATDNDILAILDVASSSNPAIVGGIQDATNLNGPDQVVVDGMYAYVINSIDNSLRIIELSGVRAPTADIGVLAAGSLSVRNDADIAGRLSAGTLYVNDGLFSRNKISVYNNDVRVYQGTLRPYAGFGDGPCELDLGAGTCEMGGAVDMVIKEGIAYIAGKTDNGIQMVDLQDVQNPVYGNAIDATNDNVPLNGVSSLALYQNDMLLAASANDNSLSVFKIVNNNKLALIASTTDSICEAEQGAGACHLGGATDLAMYGDYVFVAGENDDGIDVYDLSNPYHPNLIASLTTNDGPFDGVASLEIQGDRLFVASKVDSSVAVVDIYDPYHPTVLSSIVDDVNIHLGGANSIAVSGHRVAVTAESEDSLVLLDIATSTLQHMSEITNAACDAKVGGQGCALGGANNVEIRNNTAYVSGGTDNGVAEIDITDTNNPKHMISTFDGENTTIDRPVRAIGYGKYLFIISKNASLVQVFELDGFVAPAASIDSLQAGVALIDGWLEAGGKITGGALEIGNGGAVINNTLVVPHGFIQVTNGDPRHLDALDDVACELTEGAGNCALDGVSDIATNDNYIYAVSNVDNGLQIIDASDPSDLEPVAAVFASSSADVYLDGASSVEIDDDYAYISSEDDDSITTINISNPHRPKVAASIRKTICAANGCLLDGAHDIAIDGNYAYVASKNDNSISSFNITDPTHPEFIGSLTDIQLAGAAKIEIGERREIYGNEYDQVAYVTAEDANNIVSIDISNPANMYIWDVQSTGPEAPFSMPEGFDVVKHMIFVSSYLGNDVSAFTVRNDVFTPMSELSDAVCDDRLSAIEEETCSLAGASDVVAFGHNIYVAGSVDDGIEVLDVSDPEDMQHVGSIQNGGDVMLDNPVAMDVIGDTLFVAAHDSDAIEALQIPGVKAPAGTFDSLWAGSLTLAGDAIVDGKLAVDGLTVNGGITAEQRLVVRDGQLVVTAGGPEHEGSIDDTTCDAEVGGTGCKLNDASALVAIGDYVYVVSGDDSSLTLLDVSKDKDNPEYVGTLTDARLSGATAIKVIDDYAYIVSDVADTFLVIDVSSTTNPVIVGDVEDNDCNADNCSLNGAHDVAIWGNYAFVVASNDIGLTVFDISDKTNPLFVSVLVDPVLDGGTSIDIADGIAYITAINSNALAAVDISNPRAMQLLGSVVDDANIHINEPHDVDIVGHHAFVASYLDEAVSVIDIEDPGNMDEIDALIDDICDLAESDLALSDEPDSIFGKLARAIVGDVAYAASSTNPCKLSGATAIVVAGDYAYVGGQLDDGIEIINISDPTNIYHEGSVEHGNNVLLDGVSGLDIEGNRLFATANVSDSVEVMRLSGAELPTAKIGNLGAGELEVYADARVDGTLYANGGLVADTLTANGTTTIAGALWVSNTIDVLDSGGLVFENSIDQIIDDEPVVVGSVTSTTTLSGAINSYVVGNYVYTVGATGDSFAITDVTDPTNPAIIGSFVDSANFNTPNDVYVAGRYAYVTLGISDALAVVDVSEPTNPTVVGSTTSQTYLDGASSVYVSGRYAYVGAGNSDSLTVIDISDPTNPTIAGSVINATYLSDTRDLTVSGNYVYITQITLDRLVVVDVSNPANPFVVDSKTDNVNLDGASSVYVSGRYAYIGAFNGDRLTIVDISNPNTMVLKGSVADSVNLNGISGVVVAGDYAFVTGFNGNTLAVVDVSDPSAPATTTVLTDSNYLSGASDVFLSGRYAYVSSYGTSTLAVVDIHGTDLVSARIGTVETNFLHVSGDTQLAGALSVLGGITTSGGINVQGPSNFFASSTALSIVGGITQTQTIDPVLVGSVVSTTTLDRAADVHIAYPYAYVVSDSLDSLAVVDVSSPDAPTFLGSVSDATNLDGATAVTVAGKYAYIATKNAKGMAIVDVSNPKSPSLTGYATSTYMNGASAIAVSGRYAYVTGATVDWLSVVDISDPSDPVEVGTLYGGANMNNPSDIMVAGKYAYVSSKDSDSLSIIDISDPTNPTHVRSLLDSTNMNSAQGVYVVGHYAYITGGLSDSLAVIDVSDPSNPATTTTLFNSTYLNDAYDVYVSGRYAYVTSYVGNNITVIDVNDPTSIEIVGSVTNVTSLNGASGIQISGNYAYVSAQGSDALSVIDIHGTELSTARIGDLDANTLHIYNDSFFGGQVSVAGGITTGGGIYANAPSTFYSDTNAAAVSVAGGIKQTIGAEPTLVGSLVDSATLDQARGVFASFPYAYAVSETLDSLVVIDVGTPSAPVGLSNATSTYLDGATAVTVSGNYAYVAAKNADGIAVVDVSDPRLPAVVGHASSSAMNGANAIAVRGKYAYITGYYANSVTVIDISDPENPAVLGSLVDATNMNAPFDIKVQGNYAYVTGQTSDSLAVIDVSDPENPTLAGSLLDSTNMNSAQGVYVSGKYVYVTGGVGDTLAIIDVSDVAYPVLISSITDNFYLNDAYDVYVSGNYAYVTAYALNGVSVIDVSDPYTPRRVGNLIDVTNLTGATGIYVAGQYAYVSSAGSDSLSVIDVNGAVLTSARIGNVDSNTLHIYEDAFVSGALSVTGGINTTGGINALAPSSFYASSTEAALTIRQNGTGNLLDIFDGTTTALTILDGGNVGVGTTSPAANLVINGTTGQNLFQIATSTNQSILIVDENGNLGVGISSPVAKLDIQDDSNTQALRLYRNTSANGQETGIIFDVSAGGNSSLDYAKGGIFFERDDSTGGYGKGSLIFAVDTVSDTGPVSKADEKMRIDVTGNVGIGTTSPAANLVINGTTGQNLFQIATSTNQNILIVDQNGNIGIGTTSPAALLEVSGRTLLGTGFADANASYALIVGQSGSGAADALLGFDTANDSDWTVGVDSSEGAFAIANAIASNPLVSNPLFTIKDSGNVGIGTPSPTSTLHVRNSKPNLILQDTDAAYASTRAYLTFTGSASGALAGQPRTDIQWVTGMLGTTTYSIAYGPTPTELFSINGPSGNVGIGTASPNDALEILSTSDAQLRLAYDTSNYQALQVLSDGGTTWSVFGTDADLNFDFSGATDGDFSVNTNNLFVDTSSGNVGIGTTTPTRALTVIGSGAGLRVDTSGASNSGLEIYQGGAYKWAMYNQSGGDDLRFYDGTADRVTFASGGSVGIGTTSPSSLLHINQGNLTIENTASGGDDNFINFIETGYGDRFGILTDFTGSGDNNRFAITATSSGSAPTFGDAKFTILQGGNVGIGIANPTTLLDVEEATAGTPAYLRVHHSDGTNSASDAVLQLRTEEAAGGDPFIRWTIGNQSSTGEWSMGIDNNSTDAFKIANGANLETGTRLTIDYQGNVGIGTVSPNDALEILSTTDAQLRLAYDTSNYQALQVASDGGLTWSAVGTDADLNFDFSGAGSDGDFSVNSNNLFVDTSAGKVGVGTTTLSSTLTVYDNSSITGTGVGLMIQNDGTGDATAKFKLGTGNTWYAGLDNSDGDRFKISDVSWAVGSLLTILPSSDNGYVGINTNASGATTAGPHARFEVEDTNPIIRLTDERSDYGGITGEDLGTIDFYSRDSSTAADYDPIAQILVEAANGTVYPDGEFVFSVGVNGVLTEALRIHDSAAVQFTQYGAGTLVTDANGNITASSDERLKEIQGTFDKGLSAIRGLDPVNYKWATSTGYDATSTYSGFTAQDVLEFIPEAVGVGADGYYTLSDRPITAALVNAVKEIDSTLHNAGALYLATSTIGIGTSTPGFALHLESSTSTYLALFHNTDASGDGIAIRAGADANPATTTDYITFEDGDGDTVGSIEGNGAGGVTFNTTGADYAEYFYTNDTNLVAGEVVCVDSSEENAVERCRYGHDTDVMGIVSTAPAFLGNADSDKVNNSHYKAIAMLGQIPAYVSTENGAVRVGDALTAAYEDGYIMKADPGDATVGVALQDFRGSTTTPKFGKIQVLIARKNQSVTVEEVEAHVSERIAGMQIEDEVQRMVASSTAALNLDEDIQEIVNQELAKLDIETTVTERIVGFFTKLGLISDDEEEDMATTTATSTEEKVERPSWMRAVIDAVFDTFSDFGVTIANGIASFKGIFAEKVTTDELCVGETCVTENELKALLINANTDSVTEQVPEQQTHTEETTTPNNPATSTEPIETEAEHASSTEEVVAADNAETQEPAGETAPEAPSLDPEPEPEPSLDPEPEPEPVVESNPDPEPTVEPTPETDPEPTASPAENTTE